MGNRGGRLHTDDKKLTGRRWASRQWICCVLDFKNRHRTVFGDGYTELFFLDEVTAFAAGHRPCFECRRKDAEQFAAMFSAKNERARAPAMDAVLHAERLDGKAKRLHRRKIDTLPDGAMIALGGDAFALRGDRLLRWTPSGYDETHRRPRAGDVDVLDTALDHRRAEARLPAAVASERGLNLMAARSASRPARPAHRGPRRKGRRPS